MVLMFTLKATKRDGAVKITDLKDKGEIPAVFYGGKNKTATPVSVSLNEFKKVWRDAGESSTVKLALGAGADLDVLIHDVQTDPLSGSPIHADFLVVDMNKVLQVSVPLEFTGVSQAVKSGLGSLVKVMHEVEIEALPKDLPHSLNVDISKLVDVDSNIFVSDIVLPKGVTMVTKAEEVVAAIAVQKEEKEEAPVDLSAIEVEKKGKKEEEAPTEAK